MTPISFAGSSHRDFSIFIKLKVREKMNLVKLRKLNGINDIPQKVGFSGQILDFSHRNARVIKLCSDDHIYSIVGVNNKKN